MNITNFCFHLIISKIVKFAQPPIVKLGKN